MYSPVCATSAASITLADFLSRNSERYLRNPAEMAQLFYDLPDAIANTAELSNRLQFTLENLGYEFPKYPVEKGDTMPALLRRETMAGARRRYGDLTPKVAAQLETELSLIEELGLAGYFLIVWDIVRFCNREGIFAQGRGSAANSAVCYSLGITAVDPVGMKLLFERFLSKERGEWPDIDIDLPSGDDREKVIQYVYRRYGSAGRGHDRQCHHLPPQICCAGDGKSPLHLGRHGRTAQPCLH